MLGIVPQRNSFNPPKVVTLTSYRKATRRRKVSNLPKVTLLVASHQACARCNEKGKKGVRPLERQGHPLGGNSLLVPSLK